MPARARKTSQPGSATSQRKPPAKKSTPTSPPADDAAALEESDLAHDGPTEPAGPLVTEAAGLVTSRSSAEESRSSTTRWADAVDVVTTTDRSSSTTTEYEPGHTVSESSTTRTVRSERIPIPYAGPVSDRPAPVG